MIILAVIFGYVTSAIIPIILAVVAIFVSLGIVSVIGQVVDLNDFVPNIIAMMGLAVGIDYCLFILSRYRRESFRIRKQVAQSVLVQLWRCSVQWNWCCICTNRNVYNPRKTFQVFGVGAILVVFVAVFAGISFLPAIIGILATK